MGKAPVAAIAAYVAGSSAYWILAHAIDTYQGVPSHSPGSTKKLIGAGNPVSHRDMFRWCIFFLLAVNRYNGSFI